MAGATCGRLLAAEGIEATLIDKGRGAGGRLSTRRSPVGRFDHGCPGFTATHPDFLAEVRKWHKEGIVAPWPDPNENQFVGVPGMNDLIKFLLRGLDPLFGVRIAPFRAVATPWPLRTTCCELLLEADWVVSAVPAEQAAELLSVASPKLANAAAQVSSRAQWTVMAAWDSPLDIGDDMIAFENGPIATAIREKSKPGRAGGERWILTASQAYTDNHLECEKYRIINDLTSYFQLLHKTEKPAFTDAHRWRFAQPIALNPLGSFIDKTAKVAICGDWCLGDSVEAAWLSGRETALQLLARI